MTGSEANPMVISGASGSRGVEEASPDLLKNTPSNIARLEDLIEHSKGRQKYLAHTRSPSDGGDVRWYFCKVPLAENGELFFVFPLTYMGSMRFMLGQCIACIVGFSYNDWFSY